MSLPNYPPPRYAVIVASPRHWATDPRHAYLLGPDAVATLATLRRLGHDAHLARCDPQGIPQREIARLGLPPRRPRQKHRERAWF